MRTWVLGARVWCLGIRIWGVIFMAEGRGLRVHRVVPAAEPCERRALAEVALHPLGSELDGRLGVLDGPCLLAELDEACGAVTGGGVRRWFALQRKMRTRADPAPRRTPSGCRAHAKCANALADTPRPHAARGASPHDNVRSSRTCTVLRLWGQPSRPWCTRRPP